MRRFRAPSSGLDKFFAAQFSAGYITNMSGFDLRQAQGSQGMTSVARRGEPTANGLPSGCRAFAVHPEQIPQ
jgi:hypothetical protein